MSQTFSLYDIQGTQPQVPAAIHDLFRWACGLPEGQQCGGRKNSDTIQHVQDLREARKQRKKPALRRHSQRKPDDPPSQVCSTLRFKYASTYFFLASFAQPYDSNPFDDLVETITNGLMHPLDPTSEGVQCWVDHVRSKSRKRQISILGIDAETAEELYIKYRTGPLSSRASMFEMLYVLKNDPSYHNVSWSTHSHASNETVWGRVWRSLEYFNQVFLPLYISK